MSTVTVNGNTYSSAGEAANDMRSGGHRTHLLPMLADAVIDLAAKVTAAQLAETNAETAEANAELAEVNAETAETNAATSASNAAASESAAAISAAEAAASAASLHGTSTTSLLIEVASKSFTTQAGESYTAGAWVTATSAANLANWMYGQITSYAGTTLVVDVQVIGGSGTHADWNLSIAAARGAPGATGPAGTGITPQATGFTATGGTTPKTLTVDDDLTTAQAARRNAANNFTAQQTFAEVKDTVYTITDGAAFEIDPANGSIQIVTLGDNRTPAATNFEEGQIVQLGIDDGTAYSVTWTTVAPTWVTPGGTAAAPTLAATGYTWILLWKVSTTIYAAEVGQP